MVAIEDWLTAWRAYPVGRDYAHLRTSVHQETQTRHTISNKKRRLWGRPVALAAISDWPGRFPNRNRVTGTCVHLNQNGGDTSKRLKLGWMSEIAWVWSNAMSEYVEMGHRSMMRWFLGVCPAQRSFG